MRRYVLGRLIGFVPVALGVVTLTFFLMYLLPGDPAALMLAKSGASADQIARLRTELGLDDPVYVQYFRFLSNAVRGEFGRSIWSHEMVTTMIRDNLSATLELAFSALFVSILVGVLLGVTSAVYRGSWIDHLSIVISVLGVSVPMFWSGLILILIFAATLRWLPATGQGELRNLILPATVLGFASVGTITRTVRSSMVEVLQKEYITTARSKGLHTRAVVMKHGLRNALIPVVTLVGLQFGWLIGGTVIIETIFSRKGLGYLLVNAIFWKDLPLIQGVVLFSALMYLTINLIVDLSYGLIDPRIRYD